MGYSNINSTINAPYPNSSQKAVYPTNTNMLMGVNIGMTTYLTLV